MRRKALLILAVFGPSDRACNDDGHFVGRPGEGQPHRCFRFFGVFDLAFLSSFGLRLLESGLEPRRMVDQFVIMGIILQQQQHGRGIFDKVGGRTEGYA